MLAGLEYKLNYFNIVIFYSNSKIVFTLFLNVLIALVTLIVLSYIFLLLNKFGILFKIDKTMSFLNDHNYIFTHFNVHC